MSGSYEHSPADIVLRLLEDNGYVTPAEDGGSWPGSIRTEPESPDNCVTLFDTTQTTHGRDMVSGETQQHDGVQVRVRGSDPATAYIKAHRIAIFFDTVNRATVTLGVYTYRIQAITRTTDAVDLGSDQPGSLRRLYTVNALVSVRLLPGTGS